MLNSSDDLFLLAIEIDTISDLRKLSGLSEPTQNILNALESGDISGLQRLAQRLPNLTEENLANFLNVLSPQSRERLFETLDAETQKLLGEIWTATGGVSGRVSGYQVDAALELNIDLRYGITRNNNVSALAFEYNVFEARPDPNLAVYLPSDTAATGSVEFDWYRIEEEQVILTDAKNATPGGIYDTTHQDKSFAWQSELTRQSEAAHNAGSNVIVEWVLPAGTSDEMIKSLQDEIDNILELDNVRVVKATSP